MLKLEHNLKRTNQCVNLSKMTAIGGSIRSGKTNVVNALQFAIEKKIRTARFGQDVMAWAAKDESGLYSKLSDFSPGAIGHASLGTVSGSVFASAWSLAAYCDMRATGKYGITQEVEGEPPQLTLLCPAINRMDRNPLSRRAASVTADILGRFCVDASVEIDDWMRPVATKIGLDFGERFTRDSWERSVARLKELAPPRRVAGSEENEEEDPDAKETGGLVDPEQVLSRFRDGGLDAAEALRQLYTYADTTRRFRAVVGPDTKALSDTTKIVDRLAERLAAEGPIAQAETAMNLWLANLDMLCRLGPKGTWEIKGVDGTWHGPSACGSEESAFKLAYRMAWASMGSIVCVDDGELGPLQTDPVATKEWVAAYGETCSARGALAVVFIGLREETTPNGFTFIGM